MTTKTQEVSPILQAMENEKRFKLLDDGWIQDSFLDLDWGPSSKEYLTFKKSEAYCKKLGGRLPEVHELHSLVDYTKTEPAINPIFKDTQSSWYWTSTKRVGYTARWVVGFNDGVVSWRQRGRPQLCASCPPLPVLGFLTI